MSEPTPQAGAAGASPRGRFPDLFDGLLALAGQVASAREPLAAIAQAWEGLSMALAHPGLSPHSKVEVYDDAVQAQSRADQLRVQRSARMRRDDRSG